MCWKRPCYFWALAALAMALRPLAAQPPLQAAADRQLHSATSYAAALPTQAAPIKNDSDPRVKAAAKRAMQFLLKTAPRNQMAGELGLVVQALAKIHERYPDLLKEDNSTYQALLQRLRLFCRGVFRPTRSGGQDNYEAGCVAMGLAVAGGDRLAPEVKAVVDYILTKQFPNGSWSYAGVPTGDCSMTQYAILGLWEASDSAGVKVPPQVWDKAAQYLVTRQSEDGGWCYHPPDPQSGRARTSTHTMTAAGIGSLHICREHLHPAKKRRARGPIVRVSEVEAESGYKPVTTAEQIDQALERAMAWLEANFTINKATGEGDSGGGQWRYYYLYTLERAATLSNRKQFAGHDWYSEGASFIISTQRKDGAWNAGRGDLVDTSFAILFLIRSTYVSKKIHRRRLGRGTLVSGKNLPADLTKFEMVGGQLRAKAIPGKTGDLLAIIEKGNVELLEGAAAGLIQKMYRKEWKVGEKDITIIKKMIESDDPAVRRDGMKLLAATDDYRVVPLLIRGMYDEDEDVQLAALEGLCKISRKFNGFGWYAEPTDEKWAEEIEKWKQWYRMVRPQSEWEDEFPLPE